MLSKKLEYFWVPLVSISVWTAFCVIFWPALVTSDGARYWQRLFFENRSICQLTWESVLYSCFFGYASLVNLGLPTILHVLLATVVLWRAYWVLLERQKSKSAAAVFVLLILLVPAHGHLLMMTERDILFAWLCLLLTVEFIPYHEPNRGTMATWGKQTYWCLLGLLVFGVRADGVIYLLSLAWLCKKIFFYSKDALKTFLQQQSAMFLVWILFFAVVVKSELWIQHTADYTRNGYAHSLLYIIHQRPALLELPAGQDLVEIIDPDQVWTELPTEKQNYDFLKKDIPAKKIFFVSSKYIILNLDIFFEGRVLTMLRLFDRGYFYPLKNEEELKTVKSLITEDKSKRLQEYQDLINAKSTVNATSVETIFLWRPWYVLILFFIILPALYIYFRQMFYLSCPMLAHFILVFLTQPTGKPKYIYSETLIALLICILGMLQMVKKIRQIKVKAKSVA